MKNVFRIVWESVKEFWDELFVLVLMNLLTAVLLLPVVTFPPALAGLWSVGNLVARGSSIEWRDYFGAFKRYFGKSWVFALINILVGVLFYMNFRFYAPETPPFNLSPTVSLWVRTFFVFLGVLWVLLQMYLFAMLLEQDEQRVKNDVENTGRDHDYCRLYSVARASDQVSSQQDKYMGRRADGSYQQVCSAEDHDIFGSAEGCKDRF